VIVMQRLHEDDLAGRLLEKGGWPHLKIPAIAEQDECIPIGPGRIYRRKTGTLIDPRRESLEDLERLKQQMTELFFSAQYQQEPIPVAGNIIKAEWFKEYEITPTYSNNDLLIISLDTAMKGTQLADYSVATVWLARGDHSYLLDLWRERVDYPELRRAVSRLREKYAGAALLVEDKGSGTSLIQDLRAENRAVIGINPEGDKLTRAAKTSAQFEAGAVFFPKAAPWLSALKAELLGFPNVRYDDQVDSVTQALAWIEKRKQSHVPIVCPVIVRVHNPYREAFPDYRDVPR
jgi:predicted phage terminase large subunit-like protein